MLQARGHEVTYAAPLPVVSSWTQMTDEQGFIQARLMTMGVELLLSHRLAGVPDGKPHFACIHTGRPRAIPCDALVLVTGRAPRDALHRELLKVMPAGAVSRIGDCLAPSHIADAVFSGHRFAREFGEAQRSVLRRERPEP
jgi:dimethylamine/trimethylamine dehydrogenase